MKTLQSHTAGLGETWFLLDNENNLTAICPRVHPDNGLQISADEAERLLTDCTENGSTNPDEDGNMWVHAVQPPEDEAEILDVDAWSTHGETEDNERSFGPSYDADPPDEERDGTLANTASPHPPLFELADEVAILAATMAEKLVRIDTMACAIAPNAPAVEEKQMRETLAGTLALLEKCERGIRSAEKWIGADCIS